MAEFEKNKNRDTASEDSDLFGNASREMEELFGKKNRNDQQDDDFSEFENAMKHADRKEEKQEPDLPEEPTAIYGGKETGSAGGNIDPAFSYVDDTEDSAKTDIPGENGTFTEEEHTSAPEAEKEQETAAQHAAEPAEEKKENKTENKSAKSTGTAPRKKKKRKTSFWQHLLRFIIICICVCCLAGCTLVIGLSLYIADVTKDDNKILDITQIKLSYATRLMAYDDETNEWYEYQRLYSGENRVWVDYDDMPQCLIDAIVASEDHDFWNHNGVSWKRTFYAFLNEIFHMSSTQGGSTITQQLIKNITDEKQVSGLSGILRKVREIYRALEMEKNYSKEQILETYLNTFRLSGQVAGIEAAANYYFGKTTSELTVEECCSIICITKYPTAYNPYLYPDENRTQRNYILYEMHDLGYLTDEEYQEAYDASYAMTFDEANTVNVSSNDVYSYFTDAAIEEVLDDLQEYKGLSESEAYDLLYEGGLTIYLTIDPDVQEACETVAEDPDMWPEREYDSEGNLLDNQIEAGMVVMDYNGEVKGLFGGLGEKTTSRSFNRATQALRQTGSSMKPLADYAPGIELKKINYSTLFPDTASEEINGTAWPKNYDGTYGTPVTVYKAVAASLNTVAIHVLNLVGYDFAFDFLTASLGFEHLVDSRVSQWTGQVVTDRTLSLGLGALADGVTVLEMTAAYCIFGNDGEYIEPHFYTTITDASGDVILDKTQYITVTQAVSVETAEIMNYMLRGVVSEGTGTTARGGQFPIAAKSGTSSEDNDFWFIGLNPYYCIGGWMGYDENKWMTYRYHFDIQLAWKAIMDEICADLEYKDFPSNGDIVAASFCMASGDLASGACTNTRTGYYTTDNMPDNVCSHSLYTNDGNGKEVETTTDSAATN